MKNCGILKNKLFAIEENAIEIRYWKTILRYWNHSDMKKIFAILLLL